MMRVSAEGSAPIGVPSRNEEHLFQLPNYSSCNSVTTLH